jgi:hypothetical protein
LRIMSSLPLPTLRSGAKERIDEILVRTVEGRTLPAIFLGATNAKETIYWNQAGERVFGDASAGEVDEDTYTEIFSQTKFITCVCRLILRQRVADELTRRSSPRCSWWTRGWSPWTARKMSRSTSRRLPTSLSSKATIAMDRRSWRSRRTRSR